MSTRGDPRGPDPTEAPIEQVMDEILPDWRELARRMAEDGSSNEEIVAEVRKRMYEQVDSLLDTYNALGANTETSSAPYQDLTDEELDVAIDHARTNANSRPTGPEYRQWWDARAKVLEAERERRAPQPDPAPTQQGPPSWFNPEPWHCEDCGVRDQARGVPDSCPYCGSRNTAPGRP